MSTQYITVDTVSVAFGVSLKSSDAAKSKKSDAKNFAKKAKGAYALAVSFPTGTKLLSAGLGRNLKKIVVPAIALFSQLAQKHSEENHVWIIKISDELACLQVIENKSPYSDEIINISDVATSLTNKYSELQLSSGFVVHITPNFDADFLEQFDGAHMLSVTDLVNNSLISDFKMSPVTDGSLAVVLGVSVVILFGYIGYDQYTKVREQDALAKLPKIIPSDVNKDYEMQVKDLLANAGLPGASFALTLEKILKDSNASEAGWSLTSFTCSAAQCTQSWERRNGSHASLQTAFKENLTFDKNQKTATLVQNIQTAATPILAESLGNYTALEASLLSITEPLSLVGKLTLVLEPHKIYGLKANQKAEQINAAKQIRSGNFVLTGPFGLATELLKKLPANTAIRTVSIDAIQNEANPTFTIKGEYFVK